MKRMCLAHLGLFLLSLHFLSSQVVQAQTTTGAAMDMTSMNSTMMNYTMTTPTVIMTTKEKSGCGQMAAFTLLLPLAVAASLLHGCS